MLTNTLIGTAILLIILGIIFVAWSFRLPSRKNSALKLIRFGEIGVIFSLIGGLILIRFFYATLEVPERIRKEHLEERYTEEPSDVAELNLIREDRSLFE